MGAHIFLDSLSCSRSTLWCAKAVLFCQRKWKWRCRVAEVGMEAFSAAVWGGQGHSFHATNTFIAFHRTRWHQKTEVLLTRLAGAEWDIALKPWCAEFFLLSIISRCPIFPLEQDRRPVVLEGTALSGSMAGAWGQHPGRGVSHAETDTWTHGHTDTSRCRDLEVAAQAAAES